MVKDIFEYFMTFYVHTLYKMVVCVVIVVRVSTFRIEGLGFDRSLRILPMDKVLYNI